MQKTLSIPAADGFPLAATLYTPPAIAKRAILISSATGVKQEYYAELATYLAEAGGYHVLTYDYRGVGDSRQGPLHQMRAHMSDWGALDLTGALNYLAQNYPEAEIYHLAHSVGGVIFGLSPAHHRVKGMVMVASPNLYWAYAETWRKRAQLWMFIYVYIPLATRFYGYFPARPLRLGEDLPLGVMDEWTGWVKQAGYLQARLPAEAQYYEQVDLAIYALSFTDDELASERATGEWLKAYPAARLNHERLSPAQMGVARIGHTGFIRPGLRARLWPKILGQFQAWEG